MKIVWPDDLVIDENIKNSIINSETLILITNGDCGSCVEKIPYYNQKAAENHIRIAIFLYSNSNLFLLNKTELEAKNRNLMFCYDNYDSFRIHNKLARGDVSSCLLAKNNMITDFGTIEDFIK